MSVLNFDTWRFNLWASQSACSVFELALVMELLLSRLFPAALIRARSRPLSQSECRGQSRETNGAVIPVTCVTNWSSETSSGQVGVLTDRTDIKTSDYLDSVGKIIKKSFTCPQFSLFSTAHLKSKKHRSHVKKRKRSDPDGDQSQVSSAPPVCAGLSDNASATVACSETSQESSQDGRTIHKGVPVTF